MTGPGRFARGIAFDRRHSVIARSFQFAKWFWRHRGPAQTAGLGPYQFVYRYALARRGSFTLRITAPLYLSQVTRVAVSRSEGGAQFALPVMRSVPVSQGATFRSPSSVGRMEFVRLESDRSDRREGPGTTPYLPAAARTGMSLPSVAPVLGRLRSQSISPQHTIQQNTVQHFGVEHTIFALRPDRSTSMEPSTGFLPRPPAPTRVRTHSLDRVLVRFAPPAPTPRPRTFPVGSTAATQPGTLGLTQSFFISQSPAALTFLNNIHVSDRGTRSGELRLTGENARPTTQQVSRPVGATVPFAPWSGSSASGSPAYSPVFQSFAVGLPGTRSATELQLTTRMVLSTRPEQILTTNNTNYVFAQQPRPASAEPPRSLASERQEVVQLVQKEINEAMSSGAVVAAFSRNDYVRITDQVESLLKRRLLVEKERLGLSPN